MACAAGFFAYLVAGAVLSAVHLSHVGGLVLLLAIAAAVGWCSTLTGAAVAGALGWAFYAGFVTHTEGQIGITGRIDVVAVALLVGVAVVAAAAHRVVDRSADFQSLAHRVPAPRSGTLDSGPFGAAQGAHQGHRAR